MNKQSQNLIKIGITHGDFNGIGYEIIIKTLADKRTLEMFTPVVYGSSKIASYYRKALDLSDVNFNLVKKADFANPKRVNIINCFNDEVKIEVGKLSPVAGELAFLALERAIEDINWGKLDVLVTGPINKSNIQSENFQFAGHTDYLASKFNTENYLMLMVSGDMRVGMLTGHIPVKDIAAKITKELILNKVRVMNQSLKKDFGIRKPKIAMLGLNPHAGDNGLIGAEETEIIHPAIEMANEQDILTFGPYPADGFFASSNFRNFDGILAMYHDQGMLPFKTLGFENGVNFTAGLPIVRTSPAHGTAFAIAGKNMASPDSFRQAVYLAIDIYNNRMEYEELIKNPLEAQEEKQQDPSRDHRHNGQQNSGQ
ncbi:MAG: 4-hydroxythreonine-4-phosphate dehydrogenase PdxA [Bacteroidetes bacterium]|nr:4-hydroxythreonine-4-phosphate dehydrogenase PdxA [Bacteroidota bacterium]